VLFTGYQVILQREGWKRSRAPIVLITMAAEIAKADGIIIIHSDWWGRPPAILKGWIDRVIRPGIAYRFLEGDKKEGIPKGLLLVKRLLSSTYRIHR
jgi:NAD(P)H dehydrogenase (quinone)